MPPRRALRPYFRTLVTRKMKMEKEKIRVERMERKRMKR